jgi:chlorophyll synthase
LLCASSQAVNDWFDRHVDAVNEPLRPIPSGRMPGYWGLWFAIGWSALSVLAAALLGGTVAAAALFGVALSWAYSAPPLRLKKNGWLGNLACGLCYEGVAWMTGAFVIGGGAALSGRVMVLALLYSVGAHGIMTLNDFKAIQGDRRFGIASLPVKYGPQRAAQIACLVMTLAQIAVCVLLLAWHATAYATALAALIIVQGVMMRRFIKAPVEKALWYSGAGVPLFVSGMMVSAFALKGLGA